MLWTTPTQIDSLTAYNRPGAVAFGDQLHIVFPQATSSHVLVHATYNGSAWTWKQLTQTSTYHVSLAVYQGRLICAYVDSNQKVHLMAWDAQDNTWSVVAENTTNKVKKGPALASYNGLLYLLVVRDTDDKNLQYCTWNGVDSLTAYARINEKLEIKSGYTPALATHAGRLYLFNCVDNTSEVQVYAYAGQVVSGEAFVPVGSVTGTTGNATALDATSYNGQLMLFMSNASENLAYTWTGGSWDAVALAALGASYNGVAAAVYGGTLALLSSVTSGSNHPLMYAEGVVGGVRPIGAQPLLSCAGQCYATTSLPSARFWGAPTFTVEAWVNPANLTGTQYILSDLVADADANLTGLVALALREGKLSLYFLDRWIIAEGPALSAEDWHHVAATFDGRAVTLLIDGVPYGYAQFTLDDWVLPSASNAKVLIGATATSSGATGLFSGSIARVAVFNSARSDAQVGQDRFTRLQPQQNLIASLDFSRAVPVDRSGRGVTITVQGTPRYLAQTNALELDGESGLDCTVPDADVAGDLSFDATEDMTVCAWVYRGTCPNSLGTVLYRSGQYGLAISAEGSVVAFAGGGDTYKTATGLVKVEQWAHVAFIYSAGVLSIWVNGTRQIASLTTAMDTDSVDHTTIGCRPSREDGFHGAIGGVYLWRYALTQRELNAARAQSPIVTPRLAASYSFFTTSLDDTSAQNPTPTLLGSGQRLVLVNEVLDKATCAAIERVDVEVGNPYFPADVPEEEGFTLPPGQTVAGSQSLTSAQTTWLMQLILTVVLGVMGLFGVSAGAKLTSKLQTFISSNKTRIISAMNRKFTSSSVWATYGSDAVAVLLKLATNAAGLALDTVVSLLASAILDMLRGLYADGVLKSMAEIIADDLSWWDLAELFLSLAAVFVPGAGAARVASFLVSLGFLVRNIISLILSYPSGSTLKSLVAEPVPAVAPGAKRAAVLQGMFQGADAVATA